MKKEMNNRVNQETNNNVNQEENKAKQEVQLEAKGGKFIQNNKKGMEMVQVAILVAIAIGLGLLFKTNITSFIEDTFLSLTQSKF